jgi:hypothetical protein
MKDLLNDELLETLTQMRGRKFPLNDPDTGKTLFIMKKLILLVPLIANFSAAPPAYPIELTDFFSDVFWNAGYVYSPENPLGFNAGLFGFDISCSLPIENEEAGAGKKYKSEFAQASLTYGIKIFDWLRVPVGVSVYNDAVNKSADENISNSGKIGFNIGAEIIANPFSDNWKLSIKAQTINFSHFLFGAGIVYVFSDSPKPAPRPRPAPTPPPAPPPAPQPAPPPSPPTPPQGDNSGTVYYSYDGTGYVYLSQGVFYLCSSGRPVGYIDAGVIYAFSGRVLGFYESTFIYNRNGNPVGADDPKRLGINADGKRNVAKANKQGVPVKQPKEPINRPRLKNGYFGGSLRDIF